MQFVDNEKMMYSRENLMQSHKRERQRERERNSHLNKGRDFISNLIWIINRVLFIQLHTFKPAK